VVRRVECEGRVDLIFRVGGDAIGCGAYDRSPLLPSWARIHARAYFTVKKRTIVTLQSLQCDFPLNPMTYTVDGIRCRPYECIRASTGMTGFSTLTCKSSLWNEQEPQLS
jgi:hypothetical protein